MGIWKVLVATPVVATLIGVAVVRWTTPTESADTPPWAQEFMDENPNVFNSKPLDLEWTLEGK
jgi:hypothetical protein